MVSVILNCQRKGKRRGKSTILVDSTDLQVDLNFHRKKISKNLWKIKMLDVLIVHLRVFTQVSS